MPLVRLAAVALIPVVVLVSEFVPTFAPERTVTVIAVFGPLLVACLAAVIGSRLRQIQHWLLLLMPLFYWGAATLAVLLTERAAFRTVVAASVVFFLSLNAWILLRYFHFPLHYQPYSLASVSHVLGIMTLFFIGFDLSALITFLAVPSWMGIMMAFGLGGFLATHNFWTGKVGSGRALPMILVTAFLASEIFWVATFLPISASVVGALLALAVYLATGLARHVYLETATRRVAVRYSLITAVGLLLVLGTARWV